MKRDWDYTVLAKAYLKRPNYSGVAVDTILKTADMKKGIKTCVEAWRSHATLAWQAASKFDLILNQ